MRRKAGCRARYGGVNLARIRSWEPWQAMISEACSLGEHPPTLQVSLRLLRGDAISYGNSYLIAFDLDLGPMNIRPRMARSLGLVVFLAGSFLPCRAQVSENKPASVTQIQDEIKQHPGNSKLYVALGLAYWDRNDYPHALEAFQLAVKFGPMSAEAHNWVGVATLEQGDFPGAAAEFRKAISLDPKYARAYTNLGSALAKNGQLAEAVEVFRKALVLEPKNAAARVNLAVALREKGDAKGDRKST